MVPRASPPTVIFILGETPEVRNVFVGAGFDSMGIASAGGAGRALAEWIVEGEPTLDLWPVDIRRFAPFNGNPIWLHDRVKEVLGLHYAMPWPNRELKTARPLRRSPLYERLAEKGAVFGSKMGWERPNFFALSGSDRRIDYSFGRQNWFEASAAEHRACREAVAIFDMTSFAKFLMQGPDAEAVLQRLCANDIAVPVGMTVYTALLNIRGGFESDLTVARLAPETFLILTGTAQATRDAHWFRRHIPAKAQAALTDVTSAYAVLAVMGPNSRSLLSRATRASLDDAAFPFGAIREIDIGYATGWAARRSYMGELGWELYVPSEFAANVYETLVMVGGDLGLRDAGYYAVESLRLEKGYRAWGRELTPDVTPWQAGLGFAVKLDKGDFIGRDALLAARAQPLRKRLVSFLGDLLETQMPWGGELVTAEGEPVGEITSAAYGPTLGGIVALGWVQSDGEMIDQVWLDRRRFVVDIAGEGVAVRARLQPFYDPRGDRMRAAPTIGIAASMRLSLP
jgi:glycine cleavage system T protein